MRNIKISGDFTVYCIICRSVYFVGVAVGVAVGLVGVPVGPVGVPFGVQHLNRI